MYALVIFITNILLIYRIHYHLRHWDPLESLGCVYSFSQNRS